MGTGWFQQCEREHRAAGWVVVVVVVEGPVQCRGFGGRGAVCTAPLGCEPYLLCYIL